MLPNTGNPLILSIESHIGRKVKQRRQHLKLKQHQVAKILGITVQQLSKYEKGTDRISASRLLQISKALSVTTRFFYEELEENLAAGKQLLVSCANREGKKFIIQFLDEENVISHLQVLE